MTLNSGFTWFQIPDVKTGDEQIDAVVVDEEAVGSVDRPGCGAKILCRDGALEQYLKENKIKDRVVRMCYSIKLIFYFSAKHSCYT